MRKLYFFYVALLALFLGMSNVHGQISNQPTPPINDAKPGRSNPPEAINWDLMYKVNLNVHLDPNWNNSFVEFLGPWVGLQTSRGYTMISAGPCLAGELSGSKIGATFMAEHLTGTVYPMLYASQKFLPWGRDAGHSLSIWGRITAHEGISRNYGIELVSNNVEIMAERWNMQKQFNYWDFELRIRPNPKNPQFSFGVIHRIETKIFPLAGPRSSQSTGVTFNWALHDGLPNY